MDLSTEENNDVYGTIDTSRVKRRLFEDDDNIHETEAPKQNQSLESTASNNNEGSSVLWSAKANKSKVADPGIGKEVVRILLVTRNEESPLVQLIEDRCDMFFSTSSVNQCLPSNLIRHGCNTTYSLILLDMNTESDDLFFRTAETIRHSSILNRLTPLIGLKFNAVIKCDVFRKYGITDIVYGPVYHSVIDQLLTTWIVEKGKGASTSAQSDTSLPEGGRHSASASCKNGGQSVDGSYPRFHTTSENRPNFVSDAVGSGQSNVANTSCNQSLMPRLVNQRMMPLNKPLANFPIITKTFHQGTTRPSQSAANTDQDVNGPSQAEQVNNPPISAWTSSQATTGFQPQNKGANGSSSNPSFSSKDNSELHTNVSTPSMCSVYPTPPPTLGSSACRYPFVTPVSYTPIPPHQNCTYVINGTPGTSGMRITYIPDELNKHSTKERERRERIKQSCNQLRSILPRQAMNGRKADMATVLEMAVFYLRIIQTQIPQHVQQQIAQLFCSFQTKCKRKRGDSADPGEPANKSRLMDQSYYSTTPYVPEIPQPPLNPPFLYPGPASSSCPGMPVSSAFTHLQGASQIPSHNLSYLSQYGYSSTIHHGRQTPYLPSHQPLHPKPFTNDHLSQGFTSQGLSLYVDVNHGSKDVPLQSNERAEESLAANETF